MPESSEGPREKLQHDRISGLLDALAREHGEIDPEVMEEVREAWPDPDVEDRPHGG